MTQWLPPLFWQFDSDAILAWLASGPMDMPPTVRTGGLSLASPTERAT